MVSSYNIGNVSHGCHITLNLYENHGCLKFKFFFANDTPRNLLKLILNLCMPEINNTSFLFLENQIRKFHISNSLQKKRDFYEVLGIPRNASSKEIKKSYYDLAKKYHPDTNKNDPNAAKKFQEVSEAYEVTEMFFSVLYFKIEH